MYNSQSLLPSSVLLFAVRRKSFRFKCPMLLCQSFDSFFPTLKITITGLLCGFDVKKKRLVISSRFHETSFTEKHYRMSVFNYFWKRKLNFSCFNSKTNFLSSKSSTLTSTSPIPLTFFFPPYAFSTTVSNFLDFVNHSFWCASRDLPESMIKSHLLV